MGYKGKNRIVATFLFAILSASDVTAGNLIVAVVDSGNDAKYSTAPICSFSSVDFDLSPISHGTNVVNLIKTYAGKDGYCILPFSVIHPESNMDEYLGVLTALTYMKIDVLNLSIVGTKYNEKETELLRRLLNKGVSILAAAGNQGIEITRENCKVYPACDDSRITVVGSYDKDSNWGSRIDIKTHTSVGCIAGHCLIGTSQSTAAETGKYVKFLREKSK